MRNVPSSMIAGRHMRKGGDRGDGGGHGNDGRGPPKGPENSSPRAGGSHARALAISSALVVAFFLLHVLLLLLVRPWNVLPLSKLNAYAVSCIPLGMGLVFFFDAITNFIRIEARSAVHFAAFLLAILFGSLSVHGLLGFILYLVRHPPAF